MSPIQFSILQAIKHTGNSAKGYEIISYLKTANLDFPITPGIVYGNIEILLRNKYLRYDGSDLDRVFSITIPGYKEYRRTRARNKAMQVA